MLAEVITKDAIYRLVLTAIGCICYFAVAGYILFTKIIAMEGKLDRILKHLMERDREKGGK